MLPEPGKVVEVVGESAGLCENVVEMLKNVVGVFDGDTAVSDDVVADLISVQDEPAKSKYKSKEMPLWRRQHMPNPIKAFDFDHVSQASNMHK